MDDKILLHKVAQGDRHAFDMMAGRYYDSLFAFAYRIIGDYAAAEDVVQDALVNIWLSRSKIYDKSYIYTIVKNLSLTHNRNSSRRNTVPIANTLSDEDISAYYVEQEVYRSLSLAIERLPIRTGEVIKLSLEGMRQEKIGEQMGITVSTVKFLKAEGLKKLKNMLDSKDFIFLLAYIGFPHSL